MNKAVTEGLVFTPPAFSEGLANWSRGDGLAGDPSYDGALDAALIAADQDFGSCLELTKSETLQKLRAYHATPIVPGCYLRVTARVKAISGNLPTLRIAAWAGDSAGAHLPGVVETGPEVTLSTYGEVVTVSAIIGSGPRPGVDMAWGPTAAIAHVGLDLTGPTGGTVRIDDIEVEDVTVWFLRDMLDVVDVRDYGAVGDGVTNDAPAFEAADAAAAGRTVLVPAGIFHLTDHVTFENPVRFEGTVVMPADKRLELTRNFDLPSYVAAFGDEELALRKALQALFNFTDHDSLDLGGLRVSVTAPIDVQAAVGNVTSYATRRVLRNGRLEAVPGPAWDTTSFTTTASWDRNNPTVLTNVASAANVPLGALVEGQGVGREVYVSAVDPAAGTVTLSRPLWDAAGTQSYTFRRFAYMLDFSGFASLSRFVIDDVELACGGVASGIMLPRGGQIFHIRDCYVTAPRDRGITSIGTGCQGMLVDRCQFLSSEMDLAVPDRTSIAINANANDIKLRDNRIVRFRHGVVLAGGGNLVTGNHIFQGDNTTAGTRMAAIVLTDPNPKSVLNGNYIDNGFVEWTNEHDATPDFTGGFGFGALAIVGNIFTANDVGSWFRWIVIRPHGQGQPLNGLTVTGNVFKVLNGSIERVEEVDSSIAALDMGSARKVVFADNTFNNVDQMTLSPVSARLDMASAQSTWAIDLGGFMPFGGKVRRVESLVAEGPVTDAAGQTVTGMPHVLPGQGALGTEVHVVWPVPASGRVQLVARVDNPL